MMIGVQGLSFTVRFEIRWTVRMSAVESACRYDGRSFLSRACHDPDARPTESREGEVYGKAKKYP